MNSKIIKRTKFWRNLIIVGLIALVPAAPAVSVSKVKHTHNEPILAPIAKVALKYQGIPYVWGGSSPNTGFDCSGFTRFVWGLEGVFLSHSTYSQINTGVRINKLRYVRPGDLLFPHPGHVMMYIGNRKVIASPQSGDVIKVSSVFDRSYIEIRRPNGPKAIKARHIRKKPNRYQLHEQALKFSLQFKLR